MLCPDCRKVGSEVIILEDNYPFTCVCGWKSFKRNEGRCFYVEYNDWPTIKETQKGYIHTIGRDSHKHLLVSICNYIIADLFGLKKELNKYGYVATEFLDIDWAARQVLLAPMLLIPEEIGILECPMSVGKVGSVSFTKLTELMQ